MRRLGIEHALWQLVPLAVGAFEIAGWVGHGCKPELLIEAVGVAGHEAESAKALERGAGENGLHELLGETAAAMALDDEDVAEIGETGVVGDDAGEADERGKVGMAGSRDGGVIDAPAQGVLDGAFDTLARDAGRPVRGREKGVDRVEIEEGRIGGDEHCGFKDRGFRIWYAGHLSLTLEAD